MVTAECRQCFLDPTSPSPSPAGRGNGSILTPSPGIEDRCHNVLVGITAADVAYQLPAELLRVGVRVAPQRRIRGHGEARGAEATLPGIIGHKRVEERAKIGTLGQPFDRDDPTPTHLQGQEMAGVHRLVIHKDGTGTALPPVTRPFRAGEIQVLPQHVQQGGAGLDLDGVGLPIDLQVELRALRSRVHVNGGTCMVHDPSDPSKESVMGDHP